MHDDTKLLTVSIAAYNAGGSLGRTLASLECDEKLMRMLDIIIVDDGSTDETADIAGRFRDRYPGSVRVFSKDNGGYGSTVNLAVRNAGGLFFKLLDGDDAFDTENLESLIEYLGSLRSHEGNQQCIPDLVITPFYFEPNGGNALELCDRHPSMQTEPVMIEDALLDDGLMMFELCVRTDVLRRSGVSLTENCFYTDNEFVMAAELSANTAVRFPAPVYRYSTGVPGQSMSIEGRRIHWQDKIRAAKGVFRIYGGFTGGSSEGPEIISGTRKVITDKLISTMAREVYVSLMLQNEPAVFRETLRDFDREVAGSYPFIYEVTGDSRLVSAARKAGPAAYGALCRYVKRKETIRMESRRSIALTAAEYITAACMVIQCRTVYMHLRDYGMIVNRSVWVLLIAALAVCIANSNAKEPRSIRKTLLLSLGIAVYAAVFIAVNPVNHLRVIRCAAAWIMMAVLLSSDEGIRTGNTIMKCFREIVVMVAAVSLAGWICGSVLKFLPCTGYAYMDWSATGEYVRIPTFLGIYFETQWTGWSLVQARNSGIFVEAPMAGCIYSIALLTYFMQTDKRAVCSKGDDRLKRISVLLLTAAILSTFSLISYGFLLLAAAALIYVSRADQAGNGSRGRTAATLVLMAGAAVLVLLVVKKTQLPTGTVRFNDFVVGFNAWLAHPFFGGGFESLEYLQQFMPEWRSFDTGFSNSPMEILGQGGLYLAAPYAYAFSVSFAGSRKNRNLYMCMAVILFAYIFTFTVIPYQYITFFMLILMTMITAGIDER